MSEPMVGRYGKGGVGRGCEMAKLHSDLCIPFPIPARPHKVKVGIVNGKKMEAWNVHIIFILLGNESINQNRWLFVVAIEKYFLGKNEQKKNV